MSDSKEKEAYKKRMAENQAKEDEFFEEARRIIELDGPRPWPRLEDEDE